MSVDVDPYSSDENYLRRMIESSYPRFLAVDEPEWESGLLPPLICASTEYYVDMRRLMDRHFVDVRPAETILDCGCGVGILTFECASHGRNTVGIDSSPKMIAFCKQCQTSVGPFHVELPGIGHRARRGTLTLPDEFRRASSRFELGNVLDLSYDTGSIGGVICSNVLDRVTEPRKAAEELARVMAPGAVALVSSPLDWRAEHTPDAGQWVESLLQLFCPNCCEILEYKTAVAYELRTSDLSIEHYRCEVLVIRRR